jgi:eukaryotic-like serine/threonine-protein kinase
MKAPDSSSSPQPIAQQSLPVMLGRYELLGALARGGMATVHLARHRGEAGFQRLFAIKVLHPHLADDEEFVSMLLDEARIAARLHHPNVVPIVDLGSQDGIHYVVMEYIEGCSLSALLKKNRNQRPPRLLVPIALDVLAGLHAAHSLKDDDGSPMNLVHRDVSPQNVMVGADGTARITDFGIARAESRILSTRPGQLKGKLAFMSPEQLKAAGKLDRRSDLFSAGAMLWSALTGRRLFLGDSDAATLSNVLRLPIPLPSRIGCKPPAAFDPVLLAALERDLNKRFQTAQQMEEALREVALSASCLGSRREVAEWVAGAFGEELAARRRAIRAAVSQRPALDSSASASGLAAIASVGSHTPSRPRAEIASSPTPVSHSARDQIEEKGRRRWLFPIGAVALGAAVLFAGVHLVARTAATPAARAELAAQLPATVAVAQTEAAPAAVPAARAAQRDPAPPSAAPPSAPTAAAKRSARRAGGPEPAPAVGVKAVQPATPAQPQPPAAEEPSKPPRRWHTDAPTLPPE